METKTYWIRYGFKVDFPRITGARVSGIGGQSVELTAFEYGRHAAYLQEEPIVPNFEVVSGYLGWSNQMFRKGAQLYIPESDAKKLTEIEVQTHADPRFELKPLPKKAEKIAA